MKTIPYTYHVYCRPVNKHYYGVRYADGCCPDDLFKLYFTSSKIENGEIIPHSLGGNPKGTVIAKDLDGNLVKVSVEEFRTREDLKGVNFGIHPKYTTVICPHCNKQGGTNCMKRWHFNNCRLLKDKK